MKGLQRPVYTLLENPAAFAAECIYFNFLKFLWPLVLIAPRLSYCRSATCLVPQHLDLLHPTAPIL